jgi:hypothetical protein
VQLPKLKLPKASYTAPQRLWHPSPSPQVVQVLHGVTSPETWHRDTE